MRATRWWGLAIEGCRGRWQSRCTSATADPAPEGEGGMRQANGRKWRSPIAWRISQRWAGIQTTPDRLFSAESEDHLRSRKCRKRGICEVGWVFRQKVTYSAGQKVLRLIGVNGRGRATGFVPVWARTIWSNINKVCCPYKMTSRGNGGPRCLRRENFRDGMC